MRALEFSPEEWTQEELKARQEKVQEMLKRNEPTPQEQQATEQAWADGALKSQTNSADHKSRKPRSDKGQKRKPEPLTEPQKAGAITPEQAKELSDLITDELVAIQSLADAELKVVEAATAQIEARTNRQKASKARIAFVDSLTKP